ncbi:MAG: patatin family protein [Candidatus Fimivicinus sp.]|nr:patatin family protein [Oscillospiraceae bacterium]MDY5590823.1 patatin family protein [Candidatus Fimivicinus sp.]
MKTGLVLEGGGLRGIYTVGVLDVMMEQGLFPDYAVGVSAGAANAVSYLSGQKGRGYRVNMEYLGDKRYMSLSNLIRKRSLFGMDLIFDEIPNSLDVLDYDAIQRSPIEFYTGVTSCEDGRALYFGKEYLTHDCNLLCASASIPILSQPVEIDGIPCVDGGVADPIPVQKALDDGCDQIIAVLTQPRGYRQSPMRMRPAYHRMLRRYPRLVQTLDRRHTVYNACLAQLEQLEHCLRAFVIAPSRPLPTSWMCKDPARMQETYEIGRKDAVEALHKGLAKAF